MHTVIADYHMHTTISPDGKNNMGQMCQTAIEKGISEIAFTDHFEIFTPDFKGSRYSPPGQFTVSYLKRYFEEFEKTQEIWDGKIRLKRAIELGQPHVNPEFSAQILEMFSFDYVVGSMHKVDNIDFSERDYTIGQNKTLCEKNLAWMYEMVDQGDFDCLGHADLIKRYASRQGQWVSLMDYPDELSAILKRLIERGKGMELNTSGFRQGMGEPIPCLEFLTLYRKLGGTILTIGSDAHCREDLAADFDKARLIALKAGFHQIALYENRTCHFYSID
jgi:histidinol-phosphatase (PHP family)